MFEAYKKRLASLLGDMVIEIQHMGSTAIRGMVAKPQIDVMVVVKDLSKISALYHSFVEAGFTPQGKEYVGIGDEYFTEDAPDGRRLASIHVFEQGHPDIEMRKIFHDYLMQNENDRNLYIKAKRKLYALHKDDYEGYDSGKMKVIEAIKVRAKAWTATHRV